MFVKILLMFSISFFGTYTTSKNLALDLAERFFDSGNYEEAITEYKRFIFYNPQSESISYAYYKIGLAYRNEKKWNESINALHLSIQTATSESIKNEREIALAVVLIASGNYSDAEFQLLKVESFSPFLLLRRKAAFFRGIASLYAHKWKDARTAFQKYFKEDSLFESSVLSRSLDSLLLLAQYLKYKSPRLAKILSTILPGSGQIYAGDILNGLNSLVINSLTGYLLVSSLIKGDFTGAILIYVPLFQRYYLGNRFRAEKIAENYNKKLNEKIINNILRTILNEQDN